MSAKIDPITRSVVQHRLSSIVKEMGEAMLRTSYSQILNSSRDFSLAICDPGGRWIAQADRLPVHVGALPWATLAVEERFKDVKAGDVILLNDPYNGGSHLPDLTAFVPVFAGDKRLLWTIVRPHQRAIGAATHGPYNPAATEIYQEGLRVPPIKLYEAGKLRDDLLDLLALNIRNPREFRGDLAAMVGAAHLGERRLSRLFAEFGEPVVEAAIEAILDATEQQTRAVVSTWKDGVFHGEAFLDDDGHGRYDIRIAAKVTKSGSNVEVDLSASDPQSTSFVNSSHANMQAAVAMAFAYLIDADIPKNSGALRPLKVIAEQGTVVWAGSGGDGQFRGGLGVALDLVLETEKPARGNTAGDGARHGPCGMLGGEDGEPHRYRLLSEGREPRVLRTKEVGIEIHPGDCLEIRSSGGGGWGAPEKRSAEARHRDREQGLTDVATEQASP